MVLGKMGIMPHIWLFMTSADFIGIHRTLAAGVPDIKDMDQVPVEQVMDPEIKKQIERAQALAQQQKQQAQPTSARNKVWPNAMDPTGEHPLKRFGTRPLVCSACKAAATQFQNRVARKIKGKMKEEEKRTTFEAKLPEACAEAAYPEKMYVFDRKDGKGQFLGDETSLRGKGQMALKRTGAQVKAEFLDGCRHLLEVEFKDVLMAKLVSNPKKSGKDFDFVGWLCGPQTAQYCDADEESEGDDGEL